MALTLGDNFSYQGAKPLDARLKYDTLAAMKAVDDATMYDGCMAYCSATDKTYQWKSTNTVDETLGRWREFSSGGSTGGGHTIEDAEGTDLTQRDTLQFGEGFKAEDDDTNEKTVISPDVMQSGDMSDIITPLPSIQPRYQKYSTEEQVVGEWINGDTVYQKTVVETGTSSASSGFDYITINLVTGVDTLIEANGMIYDGNGRVYSTGGTMGDSLGTVSVMGRFGMDNHTVMYTALNNMAVAGSNNLTIKATIRYTKVSS